MSNSTTKGGTPIAIITASVLSAIGIACWNLLPVTLGAAADEYQLSDQQIGLLGSSLLTGWLIATVPAFFYLHVVNRKWVTVAGATLAAAGSVLSVYFNSIVSLYVTWAVAGFGMALVYCISIQLVAELGDVEKSFGYKLVSEVTGGAILLYTFPVLLISTWHYTGAGYGVAFVYLAALVFLRWISVHPPVNPSDTINTNEKVSAGAWLAVLGLLVFLSGVTGLWAFLERIGASVGTSPGQMGTILAILKLVGGLAGVTVIVAASKYGIRWPHVLTVLTIVAGVVMLYYAKGTVLFAAGAWCWEYGFSLGAAYQFAAITRLDKTNRLVLLIPSCIGLAGMVGPALAGFIKDADSFSNIYIFAILTAVVPSLLYYRLMSFAPKPVL